MRKEEIDLKEEIEKLGKHWGFDIYESTDVIVYEHNNSSMDIYDYHAYDNLYAAATKACDILGNDGINQETVDNILYFMAYDNEVENILDYAADHITENALDVLIQRGYNFKLKDTRCQIAELIGRKKNERWRLQLKKLLCDPNLVVMKSARNAEENWDAIL